MADCMVTVEHVLRDQGVTKDEWDEARQRVGERSLDERVAEALHRWYFATVWEGLTPEQVGTETENAGRFITLLAGLGVAVREAI